MSFKDVVNILYEMSRNIKEFPIYDLTTIIISYVYQTPTVCVKTFVEHDDTLSSIMELEDGCIVCGLSCGKIKIYKKGKCIQTLFKHENAVDSLVKLTNNKFASKSWDNTIKIWENNSGIIKCAQTIPPKTILHLSENPKMINLCLEQTVE